MVNNETRTCKDCKSIKPLIEFRVCKVNPKTGTKTIDTKCIPCRRLTQINYNKTAQYYKPKEVKSKAGRKPKPVELVKPVETYSEPKSNKYLNNKDLHIELVISRETGKLTPAAQNMLILLVKNVSKKFRYNNIDDKLDCEAEAMYQVFKNWYVYNEHKGSAFSVITEIAKRGFAQGFNRIYKKFDGEYMYNKTISMSGWGEDNNSDLNI